MDSWPHAPPHKLKKCNLFIVTCGTYLKKHHFKGDKKLNFLQDPLLNIAKQNAWEMHAWVIFSNHYHFIARVPCGLQIKSCLTSFHHYTADTINRQDNTSGRQVWFNYFNTALTIYTSYLARLNYVHQNPVKQGLVEKASHYPWCSAHLFETYASKAFVKSLYRFDYSQVKIYDEF